MQAKMLVLMVFGVFAQLVSEVFGHGMVLDPPNRSSLWRFNDSLPANYNDNQNFCGGFYVSTVRPYIYATFESRKFCVYASLSCL